MANEIIKLMIIKIDQNQEDGEEEKIHAMNIKIQKPYIWNLADISNTVSKIAGNNISDFPMSSIVSISATQTASLQLLSSAQSHISTRTAEISSVFKDSIRPIKKNIKVSVPRMWWYDGSTCVANTF